MYNAQIIQRLFERNEWGTMADAINAAKDEAIKAAQAGNADMSVAILDRIENVERNHLNPEAWGQLATYCDWEREGDRAWEAELGIAQ